MWQEADRSSQYPVEQQPIFRIHSRQGKAQQTCLEAFPDDVGLRVARLAGGWLADMHLLEQGTQEVEGADGGVLKQGEGFEDEAAPRS